MVWLSWRVFPDCVGRALRLVWAKIVPLATIRNQIIFECDFTSIRLAAFDVIQERDTCLHPWDLFASFAESCQSKCKIPLDVPVTVKTLDRFETVFFLQVFGSAVSMEASHMKPVFGKLVFSSQKDSTMCVLFWIFALDWFGFFRNIFWMGQWLSPVPLPPPPAKGKDDEIADVNFVADKAIFSCNF